MKKFVAIVVMAIFVMPLAITFVAATDSSTFGLAPTDQPSTGDQNRDHALHDAEQRNMFGIFSYDPSTGNVSGRFLTFVIDKNTGVIADYIIKRDAGNIPLLNQVQLASFSAIGNPRADGAMFAYNGTDMRIMAHNNPPVVLVYRTQGATNNVTYTLSSGFTATAIPNSTNVAIEGDGHFALLLIENGTASIVGSHVTVNLQPWAKSVLRFQPDIGLYAQMNQSLINDAIALGKLACECGLVAYDGTVEQDFMGYQEGLTLRVQEAVQNRLELRVSAEYNAGKIIAIDVDNGTIQAQTASQIGLTIDQVKLQQSASVGEIFAATGIENKYCVVNAEGAFQILIYIGHFSEHTIVVELSGSSAPLPISTIIIAFVAMVALVAVAVIVAMRRKQTS